MKGQTRVVWFCGTKRNPELCLLEAGENAQTRTLTAHSCLENRKQYTVVFS